MLHQSGDRYEDALVCVLDLAGGQDVHDPEVPRDTAEFIGGV